MEARGTGDAGAIRKLEPLLGEWTFPDLPTGRLTFEWMPGERFLVQRWEVPIPEAPDGLAIIGPDPSGERFVQHYFDSRGVARLYQMTFDDGVWKLWRDSPDFSPLDFSQRYTGRLSDDGRTLEGTWEICHDGTTWERDFDLTYRRVD